MKQSYLVITVLVLLIGTGAFFAGTKYQQMRNRSAAAGFMQGAAGNRTGRGGQFGQPGQTLGRANGQNFRPVNGEVLSADEKSITVKLQDGSSKIIMLGDKTAISKSATGTKEDLKPGEKVMVFGTDNSDGSVTAQNIQLNPAVRGSESAQPVQK